MVARARPRPSLVALLVCCAWACLPCEKVDPNFFNNDEWVDGAAFIAEAHFEDTTACTVDCGWGHLWRYRIATTQTYVGSPPPAVVSGYNHGSQTEVLAAASRFANYQTPRFLVLGEAFGPGGEDGAMCGLPASVPVMQLDDSVFVFTEDGEGLCSIPEVLQLHNNYPEDGRRDGYTFQQRAVACGKQRPTKDVMASIERSRQRRPTREPFTRPGSDRVCHHPAGWDGGPVVGGDG